MIKNFNQDLLLPESQCQKFDVPLSSKNLMSSLKDFYRHKKDQIIPVVFAVNKKYVPYLAVTIRSILENANSGKLYDIYVLHTDLSENAQISLEEMTHANVRVSCLNISKKVQGISFYDRDYYSLVMWYRLFIPEVLYGYDKILYLDTDTIVESDLMDLFNVDLGDFWVGACQARSLYKYAEDKLSLVGKSYFNSGVLLLNIPQWQKNNLTQKCLKLVDSKNKYRFPDQDILNIVCQNHTLILPPYWNCAWYYFDLSKESWFPEWYKTAYKKAQIIHYSSVKKPWNTPKKFLADKWWKYARHLPFYEQILLNNISQKTVQNPVILTKDPLMCRKENLYPDMVKFVKKFAKYLFSFGRKRKKYQKELQKLLVGMYKKV